MKAIEPTDQVKRQITELDEENPSEFDFLLCCGDDKGLSEYFNHLAVRNDDTLLVHSVRIHPELINARYLCLGQAIRKRKTLVLIEQVKAALSRVSTRLNDTNAVLFHQHGKLDVKSPIDYAELDDRERPKNVLHVS